MLRRLQVIENNWVRAALNAKFPIIAIDEYQDLGAPLHRLVTELVKNNGIRVFAVGDPDQSIYGFRGAQPQLLNELANRPEFESVRLRLNYRSRQTIVRGSQLILEETRDFEAVSDQAGIVDFVECPLGLDEQADIIFDTIIPNVLASDSDRTVGDIAVLYPTARIGNNIAESAARRGMPVVRIDRGGPYPRTPLTRWIEDCAAWCSGGWLNAAPPLYELFEWWSRYMPSAGGEDRDRHAKIKLVRYLKENRDPEISLLAWLSEFESQILHAAIRLQPNAEDDVNDLADLLAASGANGPMAGWTIGGFSGQRGSREHLNLMTLHGSKGLEFDVVIMVGVDEGNLPIWSASTDGEFAEARRLFYVGLTRARHEVYLMYSGFNENQYGRRFANGPSRFLLELQAEIA